MDFTSHLLFSMWVLFFHLFRYGSTQVTDGSTPVPQHSTSPLPDGSVRLRDGFAPYEGRVEVYHEDSRSWRTVCDSTLTTNTAIVICRQLGYRTFESKMSFGPGIGPVFLMGGTKCSGSEDTLAQCPVDPASGPGDCDHSDDAGIVCGDGSPQTESTPAAATDGFIHLVDGTHPHNGRVEIYYQGEWGTICRDSSDTAAADVICKQLGYEGANPPEAVPPGGFGQGSGVIHLGHVSCEGSESKLIFCSHDKWGENDCTHADDVMVSCKTYTPPEDGAIRLVSGYNDRSGQVEISYQGVWGIVCDKDWSIKESTVVCRQLGFRPAQASFSYAYFMDELSTRPILIDGTECTGSEARLEDCNHEWRGGTCTSNDHVGVICGSPVVKTVSTKEDGRVRLSGGTYQHNGRVEIKYHGEWGTVCDSSWSLDAANVVCRQLGYPSANNALSRAYFGPGTGAIHLDQVECEGTESELVFCSYAKWGENQCDHGKDASVVCTAPLPEGELPDGTARLVGGSPSLDGRLEVRYQGLWGTVCANGWTAANSQVVCRQLGFLSADPENPHHESTYTEGASPRILLAEVACSGMEDRLADCTHEGWVATECTSRRYIGVVCSNTTTTSEPATTSLSATTSFPASTRTPTDFPDGVSESLEDGSRNGSSPDDASNGGDHSNRSNGDLTNPQPTKVHKDLLTPLWVIIILILMIPVILLVFVVGLFIKKRLATGMYKPVNQPSSMPMSQRV